MSFVDDTLRQVQAGSGDDLERRAIIAAHDAHCADRCEATVMPSLSKREKAIVALWRADVAEALENVRRVDDMRMAEIKQLNGAIEQVRDLASDDADLRSGVVGMVRVSDIRRALDRTGATG